jgi:plasmid stabilization system protein ParE
MMQVEWLESALNDVTAIWTRADRRRRQAITAAGHEIDQRLRRNAANEGESRSGRQRILFAEPLTITFQIELDGHTVTVLNVRESRRKKR